jgi:hypothetical protein
MARYQITGRDGLWEMKSGFVEEGNIYVIFQNIGSGEFVEVEVCPFEYILFTQNTFKKWDL